MIRGLVARIECQNWCDGSLRAGDIMSTQFVDGSGLVLTSSGRLVVKRVVMGINSKRFT